MTTLWYLLPALAGPLGTATTVTLMLRPIRRHDSTAESAARLREAAAFRAHLTAAPRGSAIGPAVSTIR